MTNTPHTSGSEGSSGDSVAAPTISEERVRDLISYHKERAIYFEQASDNGRLVETLREATPNWELHDLLRELLRLRSASAAPVEGVAKPSKTTNGRMEFVSLSHEIARLRTASASPAALHPTDANYNGRELYDLTSEVRKAPAAGATTAEKVCETCGGTGLILEHPAGEPFSQSLAAIDGCPDCSAAEARAPSDGVAVATREGDLVARLETVREVLVERDLNFSACIVDEAISALRTDSGVTITEDEREDAARMDWIERDCHKLRWDSDGNRIVIAAAEGTEHTGDTWREAIDAARLSKEERG